ncbi:unnamed protein product [Lactuca saligna]|uniref:Uncharacterized protein n=1 Tax=Lactuca saligna TaxID=75948 RepID=A0AA36E1A6_LACSI|nr:unnamed protein product [Lactuca saligna]
MAASNYTALLNTQEQPKEFGVIVEYLHKCLLAYALLSTSPSPQSLITEVFLSAVISTRARSKQLTVEFNLFQATLVLTKEDFVVSLGLSDIPPTPQTFSTPTSAQLLTMFKEMGYKFEDEQEPCLSRIWKSCLPTPWHFLRSVLTRCLFGSVGGRSKGKTDLWILMYGLFYDINVDYTSILWEDFLNFLPASKNKFLIHHPCWWSIIIYDAIHNSNLAPGWIPEGPKPHFSCMTPYQIRTTSESGSSQPIIIPDSILTKLDENSDSLCSYQKYIQGIISPPKKKRNHSDHASKKSAKNKKSKSISLFHAPSDYDKPSSLALVSPAHVQSVLESPNHHGSLDYDSLKDDNQDDDKQSEPENIPQDSLVQDNPDDDTPMRTIDIPSSEGLIVDDETNDMSIVLYSILSARTFTIDLDDYSPPTLKESQEKDVNEPNLSSFSQDPLQDDSTPKDTNEDNTIETEPARIRLTAQMVADGIVEIRFHTSSHSEYLQNFQEYLECMEENMCILNEKTEAWVKTLQVTIEYFEGTTAYIKGKVARNMRRIETLDQKIHNTIEACLSPMNQKIDDFIQSLSNLESVYEAKLDHMQNHVTAQDRYISTLEKSIAELSKASASSSTSPFQAFSEQVQCHLDSLSSDIANLSKSNYEKINSSSGDISSLQKTVQLLVDEVKAIKQQSSSSDLCALQQKVASTDSKLDLILANLYGSNERLPEPEGGKAQHNKAMLAEKEKELIHQQGIKDPSLKVPRRKDVQFSKPLIVSEPTTQSKLSHSDPNDRGKQKIYSNLKRN